eukprot:3158831-Pyramimonas_sp.AAC.1
MLIWHPDPSRMPFDLRVRFLTWVGNDGPGRHGRDMRMIPAPNAHIANLTATRGFTVDDVDLDPTEQRPKDTPSSSEEDYPLNETEVHQQPGAEADDYPPPTDVDLALMEDMQAECVQGLPPPAIYENDMMSDDRFEYIFGSRPRPPAAWRRLALTAASSSGPPPPGADSDVLAWMSPAALSSATMLPAATPVDTSPPRECYFGLNDHVDEREGSDLAVEWSDGGGAATPPDVAAPSLHSTFAPAA